MEVIGGLLWLLMFGGLVLLLYWAPSGESWVPSAAPMDPIAAMRESRQARVRIEREAMAAWEAACQCPSFEDEVEALRRRLNPPTYNPFRIGVYAENSFEERWLRDQPYTEYRA